ncbi:MAG: subtilisin family serine protease [Verrucomicrobiales bacterium]|jgi:subtilisin family serine protease
MPASMILSTMVRRLLPIAAGIFLLFAKAGAQDERAYLPAPAAVKVLIKYGQGTRLKLPEIDGLVAVRQPHWAPNYRVIEFIDESTATAGLAMLREIPGIVSAKEMGKAARETRDFELNDPLASFDSGQPGYQWHLANSGQNGGVAGVDLNVGRAWESFRGAGVALAVLDDAVEISHPDIAPNAGNSLHFDWLDDSPENPEGSGLEEHGTACAGLAAGRGGNGLGISGVAPEATLVGLRMLGNVIDDEVEGGSLAHEAQAIHIKSSSWGPGDRNTAPDGPAELAAAALEHGARTGRGGLGTLYVWAAGNGRDDGDFSNHDGYANSIYTIAVGAVADTGAITDYGEVGSNVLISAPSSGGGQDITTTDLTGVAGKNSGFSGANFSDADYRNNFGGTSASAPMIAGALALLLDANNALSWRDVQEILLRSGRRVQPDDAGWLQNASRFQFHPALGAGLLDVSAAVDLAAHWSPLSPQVQSSVAAAELAIEIPDGDASGVTLPVTFPANDQALRVEHVTVDVLVRHAAKGQLRIDLVSPAGTVSPLAIPHTARGLDENRDFDWRFMSVFHWGETLAGDWRLIISDATSGVSGRIEQFAVTAYGSKPDEAIPTTYAMWVATHFAENPDSAPAMDPDSDGIANLLEYAFGTDPLAGSEAMDAALEFRKNPLLTDLDWLPEQSQDLEIWTNATSTLLRTDEAGMEVRRLHASGDDVTSNGYFRLRVQLRAAAP